MTLNLSKHWKTLTGDFCKEQFKLMIKIILTTMIIMTFIGFIQFRGQTETTIAELQTENTENYVRVYRLQTAMLHSNEELNALQGELDALRDSVLNINNYTEEKMQILIQEIIQKNIESLEGK